MKQFNVQVAGQDFVPLLAWSADPSVSAAALLAPEPRDLLLLDEAVDQMAIVPQVSLETLLERLGDSVYGRLGAQVAAANPTGEDGAITPSTYLLLDLAQVSHATVLATTGALVGLLVTQMKRVVATKRVLAGISSQAQCWLQQAGVTAHQLLLPQGVTVLRQLLQQLLTQNEQSDAYVPAGCDTHAGQLAQEAVALAQGNLAALRLPASWRLLRVAGLEQHLKRSE